MSKTLIIVLVVILLAILALLLWGGRTEAPSSQSDTTSEIQQDLDQINLSGDLDSEFGEVDAGVNSL